MNGLHLEGGLDNWSKWVKWSDRKTLTGINYPGVYAIVVSDDKIDGTSFKCIPEIAYFGMTNSKGGLRSRLKQFDNTISGKDGHGGARRFRKKYPKYDSLIKRLYVAIRPFECDSSSILPKDLLIKGKVAEYEYICFAEYVKKFGQLPEFNDMKRSPKG